MPSLIFLRLWENRLMWLILPCLISKIPHQRHMNIIRWWHAFQHLLKLQISNKGPRRVIFDSFCPWGLLLDMKPNHFSLESKSEANGLSHSRLEISVGVQSDSWHDWFGQVAHFILADPRLPHPLGPRISLPSSRFCLGAVARNDSRLSFQLANLSLAHSPAICSPREPVEAYLRPVTSPHFLFCFFWEQIMLTWTWVKHDILRRLTLEMMKPRNEWVKVRTFAPSFAIGALSRWLPKQAASFHERH